MQNYSIFILTHGNSPFAQQAKNCLPGFDIIIFDGTGYSGYSKIINSCIMQAKKEIIIIINHKIRATPLHIFKMVNLLCQGYALVCLQNFHFWGFKKDLIRKIGFWDERFIGAQFEDSDFIRRLIENNIGWYDSTETFVIQQKNSWIDNSKAIEHFYKKWKDGKLERLLPEENYKYDIGKYKGTKFLDLTHTILSKSNQDYFNSMNFKFK